MKGENGFKLLAGALFVFALASCNEATVSSNDDDAKADSDLPVVRDSVHVRDSVRLHDSVRVINSVNFYDSLNIIDSVHVIDSVNYIDSVRIIDSVNVIDNVVTRDSVVIYDLEHYFGKCTVENSDIIKSTTINGEERSFICDKNTLLWRVATPIDWNNKFIYESHVVDFTPIQTVVKNLAETEKLIVIIRHAQRGSDYSMTGPLDSTGMVQAFKLGESLQKDSLNRDSTMEDIEVYYGASQFVRAHQTNNHIAKGRGELDTLADTIPQLNDDWFVKDADAYKKAKDDNGGGWNVASEWAYEGGYVDALYNLEERSTELLDDYLIPAFENSGKQIGFFVSHDVVMVPLVVYASAKNIDLKYYESTTDHWLNYLAGIAIVFKPDGTRVFYAVKGLESGTM
jgi:broad specificity phosphatase PhoE